MCGATELFRDGSNTLVFESMAAGDFPDGSTRIKFDARVEGSVSRDGRIEFPFGLPVNIRAVDQPPGCPIKYVNQALEGFGKPFMTVTAFSISSSGSGKLTSLFSKYA